jgi:hypothetical protein
MLAVRDNPTMSRFEMTVCSAVAFVEYAGLGSDRTGPQRYLEACFAGQGVGSRLVARSI